MASLANELGHKYHDENKKMRLMIQKELKRGFKMYRSELENQLKEKQKELNAYQTYRKKSRSEKHAIIDINTNGEEEYHSSDDDDDEDAREERAAYEGLCRQL